MQQHSAKMTDLFGNVCLHFSRLYIEMQLGQLEYLRKLSPLLSRNTFADLTLQGSLLIKPVIGFNLNALSTR